MAKTLKAPFPYFGGKSKVAKIVWDRFGSISNYVEPFFGSGAVLLAGPDDENRIETVNDKCGFISNFWRAIQQDPEQTAFHADWPVNENDLHARHYWLVQQKESLQDRLEGDPEFYDAKIAGWWCWGMCCWIGSGFCSGDGPWVVKDGLLVNSGDKGKGVNRQLIHLSDKGQGVNRQLIHLGGHWSAGIGVNSGRGYGNGIYDWFQKLSDRFRRVRVCCGDWSRVCGPIVTIKQGITGVFLDPPYSADRAELYRVEDFNISKQVREWAIEWGKYPQMRIALCGYEGEHEMPDDWECYQWKAAGGYASTGDGIGKENCHKERIWFSPNFVREQDLFGSLIDDEAFAGT